VWQWGWGGGGGGCVGVAVPMHIGPESLTAGGTEFTAGVIYVADLFHTAFHHTGAVCCSGTSHMILS